MFKKILVATDASEYSRRAFKTALDLAQKFQSKIELLFVAYAPEAHWGYNSTYTIKITHEEIKERGRVTLEETLKGFDVGEVPIEKKIIQGHESSVIMEEVANQKIDLVVMGSHGYGPITGAVLGSVSQRVLRKAACPVLIVK